MADVRASAPARLERRHGAHELSAQQRPYMAPPSPDRTFHTLDPSDSIPRPAAPHHAPRMRCGDPILPPGTSRVNAPPVPPVQVSRVAVLANAALPSVDRATLAVVAGPDAAADTADLLSTAPAALVVSSGHEIPTFAVDYPILMLPPGPGPHKLAV